MWLSPCSLSINRDASSESSEGEIASDEAGDDDSDDENEEENASQEDSEEEVPVSRLVAALNRVIISERARRPLCAPPGA